MVNVTHSGLSKFLCYVVLEFKMMGLDCVNGQLDGTQWQWSMELDLASMVDKIGHCIIASDI